jgi:hypothetical protein
MSFHVYISHPEFKENPIDSVEWIKAAQAVAKDYDVELREKREEGKIVSCGVHLKGKKRQRITMTPHGLLHAQDPSEKLVEVMFEISRLLGAQVYSERLSAYKSVDDWRRRTKSFRERRSVAKEKHGFKKRKNLAIVSLIVVGIVLWVYFFSV